MNNMEETLSKNRWNTYRKKESRENVLHKVTEMWSEAGLEIPNEVVDRAHRVGPSYTDENSNVECKSVIVRFTAIQHRTMVHWAKKKMKPGARAKLNLTESRYTYLLISIKLWSITWYWIIVWY